jgi:bifunctional non-homologous end joining protein LigD
MATVRSIELFFQEGSSDKVYNAKIVGDAGKFDVVVAWGRRGSSLNEGKKAIGVSRADADKTFDRLVREKRGKGYEEITAAVRPAAVAPPEGEGSGSKVTGKRAKIGVAAQLLVALEDDELDRALADDRMVAQQKLDGVRVLVHRADTLIATNRDGQVTELAGAALAGLEYLPQDTIVDGEVLDDAFWLFDVLRLAGTDVRKLGYLERHGLLDSELEPALTRGASVLPVAIGGKKKRSLLTKLRAARAEGMVFKDRGAPYTSGRPSSGGPQRKYKLIKSADVVIIENAGNAYRMAVYDGRTLVDIGRVFAGTTNASRKDLDARLARGEQPVAEVNYLYATDDQKLFQPVFVKARDDKRANECLRDQLIHTNRRIVT